jgi:hypothetical protein
MRKIGNQGKNRSVLWKANSVRCCIIVAVKGTQETLTMNLSSLNADVILHLMKFVVPVDRFNLVLSGILNGFENLSKGWHLRKRYSEHFSFGFKL